MGPRTLLNLVLAAVVVALLWLHFGSTVDGPAAPGLRVLDIDPATVDLIRIETTSHEPVALARTPEGWRITTPYRAAADPFRVRTLLGLASAVSDRGFRAAGNDLSQYGLEPPQATVRFGEHALHLGTTDPVDNRRYVLAQDQVHLVEDHWFSQVFGDAQAWLDPRPLGGASDLLAIALPQARWELAADGWMRTPPDETLPADAGSRIAGAWRDARALSVRAIDPGLSWSRTVTVTLGERAVTFIVATTKDAVFLGNADLEVQYRFLPRQGDALLERAPAKESRRVTTPAN